MSEKNSIYILHKNYIKLAELLTKISNDIYFHAKCAQFVEDNKESSVYKALKKHYIWDLNFLIEELHHLLPPGFQIKETKND